MSQSLAAAEHRRFFLEEIVREEARHVHRPLAGSQAVAAVTSTSAPRHRAMPR